MEREEKKVVWDCESNLYDSQELLTFYHQLHRLILRTYSSSAAAAAADSYSDSDFYSLRSTSMPHSRSVSKASVAGDCDYVENQCLCRSFRFVDDHLWPRMAAISSSVPSPSSMAQKASSDTTILSKKKKQNRMKAGLQGILKRLRSNRWGEFKRGLGLRTG